MKTRLAPVRYKTTFRSALFIQCIQAMHEGENMFHKMPEKLFSAANNYLICRISYIKKRIMINLVKTKEIKDEISKNPANVKSIIENEKEMGICITDKQGYYKAVNSRYAEIYNYPKSKFPGSHFTLVVPKDQHERLQALHDKFIDNAFELLRNWSVVDNQGKELKIQADAGHFTEIFDKTPHKITFVHID